MNFNRFTTVLTAVLLLFACKKQDRIVPPPTFSQKVIKQEIDYGKSIELTPEIPANTVSVKWILADSLLSEQKTYTFTADSAGIYLLKAVAYNQSGADTLTYQIQVFGKYADGVIVVNASSEEGYGTLSFIQDKKLYTDILGNADQKLLGKNVISAQLRQQSIYFAAQSGGNYITVLNGETLKPEKLINTSMAKNPAYIHFFDDDAYVTNANRKDRSIYKIDIKNNTITDKLSGLSDVPSIQASALQVGNTLLTINGKEIIAFTPRNGENRTFKSYATYISGVLAGNNNDFWIAVSGGSNSPAFFEHYNNNMELQETITLSNDIKLPRNANISNSGKNSFYWQETGSGKIYRFMLKEKVAEFFVSPIEHGISFTTGVKEQPGTNDVYIAGLTDFMTGEGKVLVFDSRANLLQSFSKVGDTPIDFIFNSKDLYRVKK